jgi:hypothetical protein
MSKPLTPLELGRNQPLVLWPVFKYGALVAEVVEILPLALLVAAAVEDTTN